MQFKNYGRKKYLPLLNLNKAQWWYFSYIIELVTLNTLKWLAFHSRHLPAFYKEP